jgi:hypothetical protein
MAALALPGLFAVVGIAADYAHLTLIRTELQAAVDGAVVFAAKQYALAGARNEDMAASVRSYLDEQLKTDEQLLNYDAKTSTDAKTSSVRVELSVSWTPFFAHFFDGHITPIKAASAARFIGTRNLCVLALDPKSTKAIHLDKRARLTARGCSVYSDSADSQAIRLDLDSKMAAGQICAVGGVKAKTTAISPEPVTDCPPVPDPLAERPAPAASGCDANKLALSNVTTTLSPGTYCGGLEIKGSSNVMLEPGLYTIEDGPFAIDGLAVVKGRNVGFYLKGDNATLKFKGGSEIRLSGSEAGSLAGILFFEDRGSPVGRNHAITSPGVRELTGTIYLPRGRLLVNPNAQVADESAYTAIVSYQLELTEGPELILNTSYDETSVPVPDGIKALSQVVLTD